MITEVGDEGSGLKGKAFQKDSPGLSTDSKGGRSFLNIGAQTGRGGGAGDRPSVNQLISALSDNPNGPERIKFCVNTVSTLRKPESIVPDWTDVPLT